MALSAIPLLSLGRYRLHYHAATPIHIREFPGSAWRGALGHALKQAACVTRNKDCPSCLLYRSCAYAWIFETPPPPDTTKMRRYTQAPHPFILEAPQTAEPPHEQTDYTLGLSLIGHAHRHLGLMIHALQRAASDSRGVAHNQMDLHRVEQETAPGSGQWQPVYQAGGQLTAHAITDTPIPPVPNGIAIDLLTPLRIKRNEHLVRPDNFHFADLFATLLRRISMLTYFHTDTPLETDFAALIAQAHAIPCHAELRWQEQERYSSRQQAEMKLGGLIGRIEIKGSDLAPYWPYLWLGQWAHAGSNTTMGLGHYCITSL